MKKIPVTFLTEAFLECFTEGVIKRIMSVCNFFLPELVRITRIAGFELLNDCGDIEQRPVFIGVLHYVAETRGMAP